MELNKNLPNLIQRTWDLYDEINSRIHYDGFSFCKHCLENGLCCGIEETTMEERKKLIGIRDSLKDVQDMLIFLEALESRKQTHENAALGRLEASRLLLIEKINLYPGQQQQEGRKLQVLEELNEWFGNKETAHFTLKLKDYDNNDIKIGRKTKNGVVRSIKRLFKTGIRLVIISAIINYSASFCRNRQEFFRSKRKFLSPMDSKMARNLEFVKNDASNRQLDVFYGRG